MNGLNSAFYNVVAKLTEIQGYFRGVAFSIAQVVLVIAICTMAVNYALTGTGLKENIIKLLKAVVFFAVVMAAYPKIISWITVQTLSWAQGSTYTPALGNAVAASKSAIIEAALQTAAENKRGSYGERVTIKLNEDAPDLYFGELMKNGTVAPAAFLQMIMLVAGECVTAYEDAEPWSNFPHIPDLGLFLLGLVCAFFVIIVGIFALLEYLVAYLEFMFISSVGVFLFPFALWDGSKFLTEKLISAIIGFFIKLLFCTICIFLALYGFAALAHHYVETPFTGVVDQLVFIIFTCLLFFYLCKSAPGLAQSLMTGTPTLNAAGAIGAAASAVGAAAGVAGLGLRAGVGGSAALSRASGAAAGAKEAGGGMLAQAGAAAKSIGGGAFASLKSSGGDLTRSLMARPLFGGAGGGSGGGAGSRGYKGDSAVQTMLNKTNTDGSRVTYGQMMNEQFAAGKAGAARRNPPDASAPGEPIPEETATPKKELDKR
ncbi:MAG: type IV secretion system protein [Treponema sp.]|jgi:type IV secretory pathway TrbL component|nr:type IV secretion system protein [Treponema sp.]